MQELPVTVQIQQILNAHILSSCVYIAVKRNFAEIIEATDTHQASIEHISQEAKVHPAWTYAILRALAKAHIFVETEQQVFKNTPLSDCLRSDHPQSFKRRISFALSPRSHIQWSQLDYYIDEVGTSISQRLWGKEVYELFDQQQEKGSTRLSPENVIIELESPRNFNLLLEETGAFTEPAIAQVYPFKGTICDLGGGRGNLLAAIAGKHPNVEGILFERPAVVAHLKRKQTAYPFTLVGGDFFQEIPRADIYILKQVLHNWPDHLCIEILQKCAQANPDAKVLVIDQLIGGESEGLAEVLNLIMMWEQNGRERSYQEIREMGKLAGFNWSKVHSTKSPLSIVEMMR